MDVLQDKRLFERFSARFPVKFKDSRDDYGTNVFLRDASAQGVKLLTREKFFLNDRVTLDIKLPDGTDPLILNGQIVWVRPIEPNLLWDIGIKFPKIDLMKIHRLYKFNEPS
ncbi:MAG: hypothetical protein A3D10_04390 [Omnitrophica WOR_2 bacterium RIFCSPHIGHO2_02_FULL_48_11]|nr:MAG: hypothetical protein A3D10_04390 [Omnitrophica WOR_2 bacterium RIFCSPHIGHO2_02_FULL_48_11]